MSKNLQKCSSDQHMKAVFIDDLFLYMQLKLIEFHLKKQVVSPAKHFIRQEIKVTCVKSNASILLYSYLISNRLAMM